MGKCSEYAFLQCMEMPYVKDIMNELLGCFRVRSSSDDRVEHSMPPGTGSLDQTSLYARERFGIDLL